MITGLAQSPRACVLLWARWIAVALRHATCLLVLVCSLSTTQAQAAQQGTPYREEEVRFAVGDLITLAGTLTLPATTGPHPAVILISGSNADNRDAQVGDFRPFRVLADHLARLGIAVLRYDDRGVGSSTGKHTWQYTIEDYAQDVLAGVAFLQRRSEIKTSRIGLIGHSLGAVIAPLVASRSSDIAFIVLLAGYGTSGEEVALPYRRTRARAAGKTEAEIEELARFDSAVVFEAARRGGDWESITRQAQERVQRDFETLPAEERARFSSFEEYFATTYDGVLLAIAPTPMYRHFLDYDPRPSLERVRAPVLLLFGENDLSCPPEPNERLMVEALRRGGNNDHTARIISKAGHYLREAGTSANEFAPGVLDTISAWILASVGPDR